MWVARGMVELAGVYLSAALGIRVIKFHPGAGDMTYRRTMDSSDTLACDGAIQFWRFGAISSCVAILACGLCFTPLMF